MGGMDPLGDIIGTSAGPVNTGKETNGQMYVIIYAKHTYFTFT